MKEKERDPLDEMIEDKGVKFLVDGKSFMYLVGTTVDFVENEIDAKFVYNNPNVKVSRCVPTLVYRKLVTAEPALRFNPSLISCRVNVPLIWPSAIRT